jgi:hypothetical protein
MNLETLMLETCMAYAPIARPVLLMLVPGLIAWLAWIIARRSVIHSATEPGSSRAKARSYRNP